MNMLIVKYFFAVFCPENIIVLPGGSNLCMFLLDIVYGRIKETVAMCEKQALHFY